jgi:ethanolamine permease
MANDDLLPSTVAKVDARGTPRNAIIISAIFTLCYLVPFGRLIIADVLLYSLALFLEFGALVQLRKREPALRGSFQFQSAAMVSSGWPCCQ